ncbi:MAG: UDP-N-acetylmuramate:L-alanyl-gamma-D-glutamyl-meso-diaminopimelate ligase, partial [Deltaproteobacteria bacterium]|nr:UDP-N-acetylmuramate:L-alanyl-gamma-D-glutamyl-meso-diaminopimelate ligase [Deltaproteobacteria bacterium]
QSELGSDSRFSADTLADDLKKAGKSARAFENADAIATFVRAEVKPGDVVVVMSNGEFGKIQRRLVS